MFSRISAGLRRSGVLRRGYAESRSPIGVGRRSSIQTSLRRKPVVDRKPELRDILRPVIWHSEISTTAILVPNGLAFWAIRSGASIVIAIGAAVLGTICAMWMEGRWISPTFLRTLQGKATFLCLTAGSTASLIFAELGYGSYLYVFWILLILATTPYQIYQYRNGYQQTSPPDL